MLKTIDGTKAMPRKAPFRAYMEEFIEKRVRKPSRTTRRKILKGMWDTSQNLGITRSPRYWSSEEIKMLLEARESKMDGARRANTSIINEISMLNKYLRFTGNHRLSEMIESGDVRSPPNTKSHRRWLSLDQIIHLRVMARQVEDHVAMMAIQLGLDAYLRVSEMVTLNLDNIQGNIINVEQGKGCKDRIVTITERTRMDLDYYIDGSRLQMLNGHQIPYLLFHNQTKGCVPSQFGSTDSLAARIRRIGKMCDPLIQVSPHDLRRSGAQITYLANPTDRTVRDLQDALGHSTMEMTREYIGAGVVDQAATLQTRDRYLAEMYPEEFSQSESNG